VKIKHRIPDQALYRTEPVPAWYQDEVDATLARAAARERKAAQALDSAERRLLRLERAKQPTRKQKHLILVARELVEMRREELLAIQRSMQTVPASSTHRSRAAHRPVPQQHVI